MCKFKDCDKKATWRAGTWQFCDEHIMLWVTTNYVDELPKDKMFNTTWGTGYFMGTEKEA